MARSDKFDFEDVASVYGHLDKLTAVLIDLDKKADRYKLFLEMPPKNSFNSFFSAYRFEAFEEEEVLTETLAFYLIVVAIILMAAIVLLIAFFCNRFAIIIIILSSIVLSPFRRMKGGPLNISGSESSTSWNTNSPDLEVHKSLFFLDLEVHEHLFFIDLEVGAWHCLLF